MTIVTVTFTAFCSVPVDDELVEQVSLVLNDPDTAERINRMVSEIAGKEVGTLVNKVKHDHCQA